MGKEERGKGDTRGIPGPGSYKHKEVVGADGPKIAIKARNDYSPVQKEVEKVPGPGNYAPNYNQTKKREGGVSMPKSLRNEYHLEKIRQCTQDPGAYDPYDQATKNKASQWRFSSAEREGMQIKSSLKVPAPGMYNIKSTIGVAPKSSMHALTQSQPTRQASPGPGSYETHNVHK